MIWIPIAAWIAAAVVAIVLLGFCAYEIIWKSKRLQADITDLLTLSGQVQDVRAGLASAQQRLSDSGLRELS